MPDEHPLIRLRDYRFRLTPETREFAFNLLPLLRADENVRRLHITDFLIAYRDEDEDYVGIGVQFEPGQREPASFDLRMMLSNLESNHPLRLLPTQRSLTESLRRENVIPQVDAPRLIQQALMGQEGRSRLAAAMMAPIRRRLNMASIGRTAFQVEQLPQGALPVYAPLPGQPNHVADAVLRAIQDLGDAPDPGIIHSIGEPEYIGDFPVRSEIEVLHADDPRQEPIGFMMRETIGVGMINPRGLDRLGMSRYQGAITAQEVPPWPSWVVEGIWVLNLTKGFLGRIMHVDRNFIILHQSGSKAERIYRYGAFEQEWEPAIDPTLKTTFWDRLG